LSKVIIYNRSKNTNFKIRIRIVRIYEILSQTIYKTHIMSKIVLRIATLIIFLTPFIRLDAQEMNNVTLGEIIYIVADSIKGKEGNWQFMVKDRVLICIADQKHNRMRIMSPIIEQKKLTYSDMLKLMEANFHTALDVKYAISDDILWSVFIHPLKELKKTQVLNAIEQVYTAAHTYGTTYNSTGLNFPNRREEEHIKKKKI